MILNFASYFEDQIKIQQQAIRSFKWSIAALILLGVGIITVSLIIDTAKGLAPDLIKLGGGIFMAALATLPYKEIAPRRERIICYTHLKDGFERRETLSHGDQERLTQMAIDVVKENMKR
ncbi:MAG: hypothetical protein AABN33_28230 [Acidobacteriota bacterium]